MPPATQSLPLESDVPLASGPKWLQEALEAWNKNPESLRTHVVPCPRNPAELPLWTLLEEHRQQMLTLLDQAQAVQQAVQDQLREQEAVLEALVATQGVNMFMFHPHKEESRYRTLDNQQLEAPPGIPIHEVWRQRLTPESQKKDQAICEQLRNGADYPETDFDLVMPSGQHKVFRVRGKSIELNGERWVVGVNQEVTDLVMAQRKLELRLHHQEIASKQARLGFWIKDPDTGEEEWDDFLKELWELQPGEAPGLETIIRRLPESQREQLLPVMQEETLVAMQGGTGKTEILFEMPSGTRRWIRTYASTFSDGARMFMLGINQDVTAEYQQREVIRRSEQMASVGRLAAEVAHDLRSPMTLITTRVAQLRRFARPEDEERASEVEHHAQEALARANDIISRTLDQARVRSQRQPLHLSGVAQQMLSFLQDRFRDQHVSVRFQNAWEALPEEEPRVMVEPSDLALVFQNLLNNAVEALAEHPDPREVEVSVMPAERGRVACEIRDNGPGIPEGHLFKVFEEFFTTKPPTVGTGLGLAICRRTLSGFDGTLEVQNRPEGSGAIFRMELPYLFG